MQRAMSLQLLGLFSVAEFLCIQVMTFSICHCYLVGAVGFVSVCGHTVGKDLRELLDAWFAGNSARAFEIHQKLLPVYTGTFRTQGAILTKAAL